MDGALFEISLEVFNSKHILTFNNGEEVRHLAVSIDDIEGEAFIDLVNDLWDRATEVRQ